MQRMVSAVLADFKEDDRMELRTLRYFLAVANEKNITRAAELLHVTQPTLSRQLSDLEDELDTTLMIRGKRSLALTDDGILFKQRAEDIVEMTECTEQEFKGRKSTISGTVSLGATEAVSTHELVKFMKIFSEKYRGIRFHMYNAMADTLKECIDQGTLDLALVLEPVDTTRYEFIRMSKKERWGVLVNKDHPLAGLLVFAAISHIPYNLCFGRSIAAVWESTDVMVSLLLGLIALYAYKKEGYPRALKYLTIAGCCLLAYSADWNYIAVLWILGFGIFHNNIRKQTLAFVVAACIYLLQLAVYQVDTPLICRLGVFLAIPFLWMYSGEAGGKSKIMKWGYYWFYPVHLLLLFMVQQM